MGFDNSIIISGYAADIFQIGMEWPAEARRRELRDPFEVSQDLFSKRLSWDENGPFGVRCRTLRDPTPEELAAEPTQEEKDEYVWQRDNWVIEQCFKRIGYDCAVKAAKDRHMEDALKYLIPCESAEKQCRFDCIAFGKQCPFNGD